MEQLSPVDKYLRERRKFIKLGDNETQQWVYLDAKIVPHYKDKTKTSLEYKFKYTDSDHEVVWTNASADVAEQMRGVSPGQVISIHRKGTGQNDTKYTITEIND